MDDEDDDDIAEVEEAEEAELGAVEGTEDMVDALEDDSDTGCRYISSRQLPPQYSKLLPEHTMLQPVNGCGPAPVVRAVPQ